jgi:hypothetical protein
MEVGENFRGVEGGIKGGRGAFAFGIVQVEVPGAGEVVVGRGGGW